MTEDEEPRFGQVWGWDTLEGNATLYMVIGLASSGIPNMRDFVHLPSGSAVAMYWEDSFSGKRMSKWHRIDEGELI